MIPTISQKTNRFYLMIFALNVKHFKIVFLYYFYWNKALLINSIHQLHYKWHFRISWRLLVSNSFTEDRKPRFRRFLMHILTWSILSASVHQKKRRGNIDDNNDHNAILFEKDIDIMIGYSNQFCCLHKIGRMQN